MSKFGELLDVDVPVLFSFYTEWNEPSSGMHPVLRDVAAAIGDRGKIIKIDIIKKGRDKNARITGKRVITANTNW